MIYDFSKIICRIYPISIYIKMQDYTRFIARSIPYATLKILKGESHTSYIVHSEKIAHEILNYCVSQ